MKKGDKVILKENGELGIISYATTTLDLPFYFVETTSDRWSTEEKSENDFILLSDISILDEYKEEGSDIVFEGEDSNGVILSVTIPTADLANYFETEEIRVDADAEFDSAAQFIFDAWVSDSKLHDIEITIK